MAVSGRKFGLWFNLWISVFMSILMTIGITIKQAGTINIQMFLFGFVVSFFASFIVGLIIPIPKISAWFLSKMNFTKERGTGLYWLVDSAVLNTIVLVFLTLFMTVAMTGVGQLGPTTVFDRWILTIIDNWAYGYVAIFLMRPIAETLAAKCAGGYPGPAPHEEPAA